MNSLKDANFKGMKKVFLICPKKYGKQFAAM